MKQLIAIGEALIDFIPHQTGKPLKDVEDFKGVVGGAPANVCAAFAKLGGKASIITQLGVDAFGDKIVDEFKRIGVDTKMISRSVAANTSLAFVSLMENGQRDFSFYRNPSADMLLTSAQVNPEYFNNAYALHFCSVSLGNYPIKDAHRKAIEIAQKKGVVISFDPNVRLPLWKDHKALKSTINEFIPYAHILKISDEELEFITGHTTVKKARDTLFRGDVKLVLLTKGSAGAEAYTRTAWASVSSQKIKAVDTTGAGDAFIGSFLFQLFKNDISFDSIEEITDYKLFEFLSNSNRYCEFSIQRSGAIASYATREQIREFIKNNG